MRFVMYFGSVVAALSATTALAFIYNPRCVGMAHMHGQS
jgi:hypothetical protein